VVIASWQESTTDFCCFESTRHTLQRTLLKAGINKCNNSRRHQQETMLRFLLSSGEDHILSRNMTY